jgi:FixJ family two-component response regulator
MLTSCYDLVSSPIRVHRQHVMEKIGAGSLAELVRMADRLGIPTPK